MLPHTRKLRDVHSNGCCLQLSLRMVLYATVSYYAEIMQTQCGESEKCIISISLRSGNKTQQYSDDWLMSVNTYGCDLNHRIAIPGRDGYFQGRRLSVFGVSIFIHILATIYQNIWRHMSDDSSHLTYFAIFSVVIRNALEFLNIILKSNMLD
jgi:hypothetical protein